jgi:site-specific DNA recombinase
MSATNIPVKYFLYARKSSEAEDRQAASIQSQIDELMQIVKANKLEVVEIFEESQSAKKPGRPKFNQMLERIYKGEANGILCWKLDRLARNPVDGGNISWALQQGTIQHIQTFGRAYFPNDNVLLMSVELGMANQYVRDLSVNVKRGQRNKAEQGWRPTGAPVGYMNTPHKEQGFRTIVIDPVRFETTRRLWDMMLTGNYTVHQIWHYAKDAGIITQRRKSLGGKPMTRSAIYKLFTNPFYYGYFEYPKGSGVLIKGKHTPMVTEEEYDRVQKLLGRKGSPRPKQELNFAFTGSLMRCGTCGSSVTAEMKTKRQQNGNVHHYVYYHCTHRKDETCVERSIELKQLNKQVDEILSKLTISERFKNWAINNLHQLRATEATTNEVSLGNKTAELKSITAQLDALLLKYTSPANATGTLISDEEYQTLKGHLLKSKNALEEALANQGKEMEQWLELSERTFNFARYARYWFENGDTPTKRAILACLGSNLVLKDRNIHIKLHRVFDSIVINKEKIEEELESARTSEKPYADRQKGTFVPVCPTMCTTSTQRPKGIWYRKSR